MNHSGKKSRWTLALALTLCGLGASADPLLKLPNFEALADKADESVVITLDSKLLKMAARFLDSEDPEDAAVRDIVQGLTGIYVRRYSFSGDFAYPKSDIDSVRKQLASQNWQKLVETRSRKEQQAIDIFVSMNGDKANGLAVIASEPREFTIVNIVGSIDLDKLHKLEGHFGVPELQVEQNKPK